MDALRFNSLIRNCKVDKRAIEIIYEEYYAKIKLHIARRFGRLIDVDDIMHDIFLKLIQRTPEGYVRAPTTWLYTIADNYVKDVLKSLHITYELPEIVDSFNLEDTIINDDIKVALKQLDESSQQIIYLHYWEGYSLKEIAGLLGLKHDNVRTKVSRAYKKLKTIL